MYLWQTNFASDLIYGKMRKYHYSIFAGLVPVFVLSFVSHLVPYIYIPSLPQIAEYFDLGQSNTTTMMSSYYLSMSVSLLLTGIVGDGWDKKYLLYGASAMIFIGAAFASISPIFYLILAGWSFQGIGAGINNSCIADMGRAKFRPEQYHFAFFLYVDCVKSCTIGRTCHRRINYRKLVMEI